MTCNCPKCGKECEYEIPEDHYQTKVKCECGHVFAMVNWTRANMEADRRRDAERFGWEYNS